METLLNSVLILYSTETLVNSVLILYSYIRKGSLNLILSHISPIIFPFVLFTNYCIWRACIIHKKLFTFTFFFKLKCNYFIIGKFYNN